MLRLLVLLLLASTAGAAERNAVHVEYTTKDPVGTTLIYKIKEALRGSKGLSLADTEQSAVIVLSIVTLDPSTENSGVNTIYAVVWRTKAYYYLHTWSGSLGSAGSMNRRKT